MQLNLLCLLMAASVGFGCDASSAKEVITLEVRNAPKCDQSGGLNMLARPLQVEIKSGDARSVMTVTGASESGSTLHAQRGSREWTAVLSQCESASNPQKTSYACGAPTPLYETKFTTDKKNPDTFVVDLAGAKTGPLPCWRGTSSPGTLAR